MKNITWYEVDQKFIKAIELYNSTELKNTVSLEMLDQANDWENDTDIGVDDQPIFIDLIIQVMLCRVYVNIMDKKLLTAERILGHAEGLINHVVNGKTLQIVNCMPIR